MQVASFPTRALFGIEALEVSVEAHISPGLPAFVIVGLPETAVKESKERVRCAIVNSGFDFPEERITINLAPADLPKAGGRYDLAIALAVLIASEQLGTGLAAIGELELLGELALDGTLRPVPGVVQAVLAARVSNRGIVVPAANAHELAIVDYSLALGVGSLTDLVALIARLDNPEATLLSAMAAARALSAADENEKPIASSPRARFAPIRGQARAIRALEIAAAGGHNLLMLGPPGSGKTLLATTLSKLLPRMTRDEALEVACIRSAAGGATALGPAVDRPLRTPHHSATAPSLVGGGANATPGDITLAHRGVLFLDELTEFKPNVLNALREPLEAGSITISRARYRVEFPANFQLVAAMNPCPCGYVGDPRRRCRCTPDRVRNYLGKVSGPLLDRFDLIIEVPALSHAELLARGNDDEQWSRRCKHVAACRDLQHGRQQVLNSDLSPAQLDGACELTDANRAGLVTLFDKLKVSARGAHRVLRVARTIADYDGSAEVTQAHYLEAAGYRRGGFEGVY